MIFGSVPLTLVAGGVVDRGVEPFWVFVTDEASVAVVLNLFINIISYLNSYKIIFSHIA